MFSNKKDSFADANNGSNGSNNGNSTGVNNGSNGNFNLNRGSGMNTASNGRNITTTPFPLPTIPFQDQKPGTSGLRKKTQVFLKKDNYLENFIQATFDVLYKEYPNQLDKHTLVVGGDGRFHNPAAIQTIIRMAIANNFGKVYVARDGLLSTPAASAVIRNCDNAIGGFILSASHNPGGPDGDFGIKFNPSVGGPAPQSMTDAIFNRSKNLSSYMMITLPDVDLSQEGSFKVNNTTVEVFDPLAVYTELMQKIFDFDAISAMFTGGFRFNYDAMNAVTGPYAKHIFEDILGAKGEQNTPPISRGTPLPDFGGIHPDPNLTYAADLIKRMKAPKAPDFGAASDGDGDRNLILGKNLVASPENCFVSPGDSLAIILDNIDYIDYYRGKVKGVARSMPTSRAVDLVADSLAIKCYETPTGWKYFVNLMDDGKCTLCGEESFGTGSDHVREKDGIWAVLAWLNILAKSRKTVSQIVEQHWNKYGRNYFQRHDYDNLDKDKADKMLSKLNDKLPSLVGRKFAGHTITLADNFCYKDPVTGEEVPNQGIRIELDNSSRVICRLSGTGTSGATLRIYHDVYDRDYKQDVAKMVAPYGAAMLTLLDFSTYFGNRGPSVIT